jgi:hypothetical protein
VTSRILQEMLTSSYSCLDTRRAVRQSPRVSFALPIGIHGAVKQHLKDWRLSIRELIDLHRDTTAIT